METPPIEIRLAEGSSSGSVIPGFSVQLRTVPNTRMPGQRPSPPRPFNIRLILRVPISSSASVSTRLLSAPGDAGDRPRWHGDECLPEFGVTARRSWRWRPDRPGQPRGGPATDVSPSPGSRTDDDDPDERLDCG